MSQQDTKSSEAGESVFKTAALNHSATCPTPATAPLSAASAGKVTTSSRAGESHEVASRRGSSHPSTTDSTTSAPDSLAYVARGFRLSPTRSGRATLVELDDVDARDVEPDDVLVEESGAGLAPVCVVASRMGIVDLGEKSGVEPFAVPVIDARKMSGVNAGQVLAFDPRELCRVVSRKGPGVRS